MRREVTSNTAGGGKSARIHLAARSRPGAVAELVTTSARVLGGLGLERPHRLHGLGDVLRGALLPLEVPQHDLAALIGERQLERGLALVGSWRVRGIVRELARALAAQHLLELLDLLLAQYHPLVLVRLAVDRARVVAVAAALELDALGDALAH